VSNHPATILIVDDSATTRAMIKRVIGMTGLAVRRLLDAADGQQGLEVMMSSPVDIVLADLNMPVMDGVEMIRRMRCSDTLKHIPVAVISAQPDPELIAQLKHDGIAGYLPKPFTPENVRDLIGPLLDATKVMASPVDAVPDVAASLNLTLAEALAEALETMAFISPQLPGETSSPCPTSDLRLVRVAFHHGHREGSLLFAASHQFGAHVAENCQNTDDPAVTEAQADDALKELANVSCGVLLRKQPCGSAGFEMAPPVLMPPREIDEWCSRKDVVSLDADGFLISACVMTEPTGVGTEGAANGY
jgi:two-component system chemotaxis response regulator CheY